MAVVESSAGKRTDMSFHTSQQTHASCTCQQLHLPAAALVRAAEVVWQVAERGAYHPWSYHPLAALLCPLLAISLLTDSNDTILLHVNPITGSHRSQRHTQGSCQHTKAAQMLHSAAVTLQP